MAINDRITLIRRLEALTESRVITFVTGDKEPHEIFATQISEPCVPRLGELLKELTPQEKISLFLYSRGGNTSIPWRIVTLIRQYTNIFEVLIPFRAHSAATMIALGANRIHMGALGELSPIDPAINLRDAQGQVTRISVEDVIGYISLATEKVGVSRKGATEVLGLLSGSVNPVVLGSINRTHSLIRLYTQKLLALHSSGILARWRNRKIKEYLTEKLFSHSYIIGRDEARKMGLKVSYPSPDLEDVMSQLLTDYYNDAKISTIFNPSTTNETYPRVFIESATRSFISTTTFAGYTVTPQGQASARISDERWVKTP